MGGAADHGAGAYRSIDAGGVSASGSPRKESRIGMQLVLALAAITATSALILRLIPLPASAAFEAYSEKSNVRL